MRRLRWFDRNDFARYGVRYEDLVAAADVVVTKPGYGIVSECIANGAALLYTSRGHFVEHDVFVSEMPRVLRCRFIDQQDAARRALAGEHSRSARAARPARHDRYGRRRRRRARDPRRGRTPRNVVSGLSRT